MSKQKAILEQFKMDQSNQILTEERVLAKQKLKDQLKAQKDKEKRERDKIKIKLYKERKLQLNAIMNNDLFRDQNLDIPS